MSTTIHDHTPADRGPRVTPSILDTVVSIWRRWRARLCKGAGLFATALVALVACGGADAAGSGSVCPGSISLSWSISNAIGMPLSCAQVGATSIALRLQSRTGGLPIFTAFPCTNRWATTNINPGLYDVAIELHNALGGKLDTAPPVTSVLVVMGRTTTLAPITFHVGQAPPQPSGGFALTVETNPGAITNCQPPTSGGAGITGSTITLEQMNGACVGVTFIRSRGATPIGTYTVDCAAPQVAPCIEQDETLTAPDLPSGNYVLRMTGLVGTRACWRSESLMQVGPVSGPPIRQTILLLPVNGC